MSNRRIARNVAWLAIARGGTMLLKLGVATHLTRVLEPEGFGVLGFGIALVSYVALLGTLGLDILGTREVAREPAKTVELAERIVTMRLMLGGTAYAVYAVALVLLSIDPVLRMVLLAQGAVLLAQSFDVEWLYRGLEKMGPVAVRNIVADALQLAGVVWLVREPDHLLRAAWISTGAVALVAVGMWVSYRRDFGRLRLRMDPEGWRALLRPALPLTASALMIAVYYSSDRLMLGWMRGVADVGQYEAAYRLMGVVVAPSQILYQAFFPSLSASRDPAERQSRGHTFMGVSVAIGWPLAALVAVVAGPLVVWFGGTAYAPAGPPLAVLMVAAAVIYVNIVLGHALLAWDAHRPYVMAVTAGAVLNVALNLVVIPAYGATGAAWTTFGSEVAALTVLAVAYRRLAGGLPLGVPIARGAVSAASAAIPAALLLHAGMPFGLALVAGATSALVATVGVGTLTIGRIRSTIGAMLGQESAGRR